MIMRAVCLGILLFMFASSPVWAQHRPGGQLSAGDVAAQLGAGMGIGIGTGLILGFATQAAANCNDNCTDKLGIGYVTGAVLGTAIGVQVQARRQSNRLTFIAAMAGSVVGSQIMIGFGEEFDFGLGKSVLLTAMPATGAVLAHALARAGVRREWNVQVGQWQIDPPQLAVLPDPLSGGVAYQVRLSGLRF
ncbi:MAG: hypothetical protein RhofKO_37780 [Rhodothermales bacterium]